MQLHGKGQLRHHFWSEYFATIAIDFGNSDNAKDALTVLGDGWTLGEKSPHCVVWFGSGKAFDQVKSKLVSFGADDRKIDSVAKSIDFGEKFEVNILVDIVPIEQTKLF
jgi:hypothetical protein